MNKTVRGGALRRWIIGGGCAAGGFWSRIRRRSRKARPRRRASKARPVFSAAKPIEFTLHAPFSKLRRDRAESTAYARPRSRTWVTVAKSSAGRGATRGTGAKKNCEIRRVVNFTKDSTRDGSSPEWTLRGRCTAGTTTSTNSKSCREYQSMRQGGC